MPELASVVARSALFFVVAGLAFGGLELVFPVRPRGLRPRLFGGPGARADLLHALLNPLLIHPVALAIYAGLSAAIEPLGTAVEVAPLGLRALVALVLADLGAYGLHRLAHASPRLWAFHAVHHSSEELDWLAAFRQHPIDALLHVAVAAVPFLVLRVPVEAVLPLLFALRLHTVFVHSNLRTPRWLAPWIAGPAFHRRHHERGRDDRNFATLFPIFDRVLGTHAAPATHELPHGTTHPVPDGHAAQLLVPLRAGLSLTPASPTLEPTR